MRKLVFSSTISCIFLDEEVSLQLYYVLSLCARGADDSGPGRGFLLKLQAPSAFIRTSSGKHELKARLERLGLRKVL